MVLTNIIRRRWIVSLRAPNGATTLFRKTIHAIAKHYGIAEVDDSTGVYQMVNNLHEEGYINGKTT